MCFANAGFPVYLLEVDQLVASISESAGFMRRSISDSEIIEYCIFALINEGARILEQGIAASSKDIDKVYLYGYEFPQTLGGPMQYADQQGLGNVL